MYKNSGLILVILFFAFQTLHANDYKVGIGRKVITPRDPAWLNGYASKARFSPASGVEHDLWAKVLAIQESDGTRVIIVTTDVLGLTHEINEMVAKKLSEKFGIKRSELMMNSSHTHSGPMIWPAGGMFEYDTENMRIVYEYSIELINNIIAAVEIALSDLKPVKLTTAHGTGTFAINRRDPKINIRPVDHDVPILKISSLSGEVKAILFGYACHNTTLDGNYMKVSGDYAGYAQIELEKSFPGATALFMLGCGGDINPSPRGTQENAESNGKSLAQSVIQAMQNGEKPVSGTIKSAYSTVRLEFRPFDVTKYQKEMVSTDQFIQRRAKLMMQAYNKGWDVTKYDYPVQAIRFGNTLTILALAGETVVDYSLWSKKSYQTENLFVAGYSNEVMCYIPTKRILGEGGYEADQSMIYYVLPGPFAETVEAKIQAKIHEVMKAVGARKSKL